MGRNLRCLMEWNYRSSILLFDIPDVSGTQHLRSVTGILLARGRGDRGRGSAVNLGQIGAVGSFNVVVHKQDIGESGIVGLAGIPPAMTRPGDSPKVSNGRTARVHRVPLGAVEKENGIAGTLKLRDLFRWRIRAATIVGYGR
jgi:hypothetical protein